MSPSDEDPQVMGSQPSSSGTIMSDIPQELFVKILEIVYRLHRESGIAWDTNWTVPYQLVCRRWRDVISATPQFWQDIIVNRSPEWLDFSLERCAGMPITVDIFHPTAPERIFATLCRDASAIRSCHVHCDVKYMADLEGLPSLLVMPMPLLKTLLIQGPTDEDEILDVGLTRDLVPHLTTLMLWDCIAPRDIAVYTHLECLALLSTKWTGSFDEFLNVLGECSNLEILRLNQEFFAPFADELAVSAIPRDEPNEPMRQVVLPSLWRLVLEGKYAPLTHLLATLHTPRATKVELTKAPLADDEPYDPEEPIPLFTRLLALDPQLRLPFLASLRAVSITCWEGNPVQMSLRGGPGGDALFSVDYGTVECDELNTYLERNLVAVMDTFTLAAVETFELEGWIDQVEVGTWQRVFETFAGLRALRIKGRGTLTSLWLGLSRATASSLDRSEAGGGAVCCPALSEIGIDDDPLVASRFKFAATRDLFEIVRGVLRARADAGCMRLEKLQLNLGYSEQLRGQVSKNRDGFMKDVKELVGDLDYREAISKGPYGW